MSKTKSFWTTLPGVLTGIAGVITAIGGLLVVLDQIGAIKLDTSPNVIEQTRTVPEGREEIEFEPNLTAKGIEELRGQLAEIEMKIKISEEGLERSSQPQGFLHELQVTRREREKRLEEIENMQTALRTEVEQLRLQATSDPDAMRRIEQIEGETILDLENESQAVQRQVQESKDMIRNAGKNGELKGRIEDLRKQKQSLQEEIENLTRQMQPMQ